MKNRQVLLSIIAVTTIVCVALAVKNPNPTVLGMAMLAVGQLVGRVGAAKTGKDVEVVKEEARAAKEAAERVATQTNGELEARMAAAVAHGNQRLVERMDGLEIRLNRLEKPPPPPRVQT